MKDRVDWPTLRAWCLAHGAKNEFITHIQIAGQGDELSVLLEGLELNDDGRPFLASRYGPAEWRVTQPLRSLP